MNIPERLSCAIFDVDGTLTSTNALIFAAFNHLLRKHLGYEMPPEKIVSFFGPPEEGVVEKVFGAAHAADIMDEYLVYYREHHASLAHLHEGMDDALRLLKEHGAKLAVFTGKGRRTASATLEACGIAHYFDMVVTGTDVSRYKPDPDGIFRILSALNVPAGETVMVGDSMVDLRASRAAGVTMAAVLWDSYDPSGCVMPVRILYSTRSRICGVVSQS
jgi:HAD superfamily hydrolase (TIGR01509 family)